MLVAALLSRSSNAPPIGHLADEDDEFEVEIKIEVDEFEYEDEDEYLVEDSSSLLVDDLSLSSQSL